MAPPLVVTVPCTLATLVLALGLSDRSWSVLAAWALATPVVFWAGAPFLVHGGLRAARHGTTSMDTLIALGAAAYGYSVSRCCSAPARIVPMAYFDAAAVMVTLILGVGKTLEARARATAGDAVADALASHAGAGRARDRRRGGSDQALDELRPRMRVVVYTSATDVPADGVVVEGVS